MLTKIDVNSENAFYVPIEGATSKDSIICRSVEGLDPPDRDLFIGDYARDGGFYQGSRVGNRNVVLNFDLNPNPAFGETVDGLRKMLHKAFYEPLTDSDYLNLGLHLDDGRELYVGGFTEKFDGDIFAEENMVQISMICLDPYIRDVQETVLTNTPGWTTVPFTYGGSAKTGFVVKVRISAETSVLTIDNNGSKMIIDYPFGVGDVITLSTVPGSRSISVLSSGIETSILGRRRVISTWPQLKSQSNTLRVYGEGPSDVVAAVRELRYKQSYWGI